ncbi:MAG: hypothetical protein ACJAUP_001289 [Cellvibrionaceae bacterium]|jgi:hypothetical protein
MTPAGHPDPNVNTHNARKPLSENEKGNLTKVINECFELLRINYHHLYFSAYPEMDAVNTAKRLWIENLHSYHSDIIRQATHALIQQSDYLPTISRIIKKCIELSSDQALPNVHDAYSEACNAPSPKQNSHWSHPAVYYAGKKSNWRFLSSTDAKIAFPIFKNHYESVCEKLLAGYTLPPIETLALPETIETPLSKAENSQRLSKLRSELKL